MDDRRPPLTDSLAVALRHAAHGDVGEHPDDGTLHRYLSRELAGLELEQFERHVAGCGRCALELAVIARVEEDAATSTAHAAAPVVDAVRQPAREKRGGGWWRLAAGIALFIGALVLARAGGRVAASRLEPFVLTGLSNATGRDVSAGSFSVLLASGPGIEVGDLRLPDDPSFSQGDLLTVGNAVVRIEPGALLRGEVRGNLLLERPVLRLVQDASGLWNVETLGDREVESAESRRLGRREEIDRALETAKGSKSKPSPIQLTSANIRAGTLEITRGSAGAKGLTLRDVDASYATRSGNPASLSLEGSVGDDRNRVVVRGEIGPFEGDAVPQYRLADVSLDGIPLREIPGAPTTLQGELSFDGHLDSAGRSLDPIVRAARGAGDLEICCGALEERNLASDVIAGLTGSGRELDPDAQAVLSAALRRAALADALDATGTPFERLGGRVDVRAGSLEFEGLALETSLFVADTTGSLSLEGRLDASGDVRLSPEVSKVVLAAVPELSPLVTSDGSLQVPFRARGTWPKLEVGIDAQRAVARLAPNTLADRLFALLAPSSWRIAS